MNTIQTSLIALMTVMLPAAVATASSHTEGDRQTHFQKMDTDGNGGIATNENSAAAGKMFVEMDADKNGSVTAAEMDAHKTRLGQDGGMSSAEKIAKIDNNDDGEVSSTEHASAAQKMFSEADADSNGILSMSEFDAAMNAKH